MEQKSKMTRVQALLFLALAGLLPFVCYTAAAQTAADHNASGSEYYKAQEWRLAIDQFQRAVGLDPDNKIIRKNLSNAYQAYAGDLAERGDYSTAIRQLETTVQFDPTNPQPSSVLSRFSSQPRRSLIFRKWNSRKERQRRGRAGTQAAAAAS